LACWHRTPPRIARGIARLSDAVGLGHVMQARHVDAQAARRAAQEEALQ
jgi:hypothetical protein